MNPPHLKPVFSAPKPWSLYVVAGAAGFESVPTEPTSSLPATYSVPQQTIRIQNRSLGASLKCPQTLAPDETPKPTNPPQTPKPQGPNLELATQLTPHTQLKAQGPNPASSGEASMGVSWPSGSISRCLLRAA